MALVPDGSDPGTFLDPSHDFTADPSDAGTFLINALTTEESTFVDGVAATTPGVLTMLGYVTGYDLPLTVADGYMTVDVGVIT